jgi:hypothetical protein
VPDFDYECSIRALCDKTIPALFDTTKKAAFRPLSLECLEELSCVLFDCSCLVCSALEAIDTTTTKILLSLARIDWMTHAANFNHLLLHRGWDHINGTAGTAGRFGVFEHFWVNGGFHSAEIVPNIRIGASRGVMALRPYGTNHVLG